MNHKLLKATSRNIETLSNLLQFYIYDFSEYIDANVEENGRFDEYPVQKYFTENGYDPYLITVGGKYAGFVLVKFVQEEKKSYYSIAEFFIMKKYRRTGIGKSVAIEIFQLYRGEWEVYQMIKNVKAQSFWRNVIHEYTRGDYKEWHEEGRRVTQVFSSKQ